MPQHILNVRKDEFDERDRCVAPAKASGPVIVSFRKDVPYIKDQGQAGSCTAHAATEILELAFRRHKSELPASVDRSTLRFSPLFQYAQERMMEGTFSQDAGAQSRTIFQVLTQVGVCLEKEDPYSDKDIYIAPTAQMLADAKQFKADAYHRILDVDTAKTVLQSGYTFTIGTPLYEQFEGFDCSIHGLVRMPSGPSIGGHEMHVIGCDDTKDVYGEVGAFEVQNSWGADWGDHGFCWIPYAYCEALMDQIDFWTLHFGKPWAPASRG
jgi:C1A family cysteine protease